MFAHNPFYTHFRSSQMSLLSPVDTVSLFSPPENDSPDGTAFAHELESLLSWSPSTSAASTSPRISISPRSLERDRYPTPFSNSSPYEHLPARAPSPFGAGDLIIHRTPQHNLRTILGELEIPILKQIVTRLEKVLSDPWALDINGFFYPALECELLAHGDFQAVWASFQALYDTSVTHHLKPFREWKFHIVQHYNAFAFTPRPSRESLLFPLNSLIEIFSEHVCVYVSKHDRKAKQPQLFRRIDMDEPEDMTKNWQRIDMTVGEALGRTDMMTAEDHVKVGQFARELMRMNHALKGLTEKIAKIQRRVKQRVEKDRADEHLVFAGLKAMERRLEKMAEEDGREWDALFPWPKRSSQ